MIQYLILAETEETGYFVEIVDNLEFALSREKLFFELAFNPPRDNKRMREEFNQLVICSTEDLESIITDSISGSSNGINSTYVLEIDEKFSFEKFESFRNTPEN